MSIEYAKESEVVAGTILIADDGFTCIKEGAELTVKQDDNCSLFVDCKHYRHYLDGQLEDDIGYIGFTLKK